MRVEEEQLTVHFSTAIGKFRSVSYLFISFSFLYVFYYFLFFMFRRDEGDVNE